MESSFVFVQHQPFQSHQLSLSDVEKNARRCRWRRSHSKIEADDEFGLAMQRKGSWRARLYRMRKPGENQIWKSIASELVEWAATKNGETCIGRQLIRLLRMEIWRTVVFPRVEIWWNFGSKNGARGWATSQFVHPADGLVCHWRRRYGLWHRHRVQPFFKITIILEQGEWSLAKDIEPVFKRCNERQRQTFYDMGNVNVFNIGSICIHGKELLRKLTFYQKYRERSHFKADVRDIWKVDIGTISWDFWSDSN